MKRFILAMAAAVTLTGSALAQKVSTPPPGSSERRDILDAIRPSVAAKLNPPVEFVVMHLRVVGSWAFVQVTPQRPGGGKIDLKATPLASEAGDVDGVRTEAFLRKSKGRWTVKELVIGSTDVWWQGYCGEAPKGLIPKACGAQ